MDRSARIVRSTEARLLTHTHTHTHARTHTHTHPHPHARVLQAGLLADATAFREANIVDVHSYDELKQVIGEGALPSEILTESHPLELDVQGVTHVFNSRMVWCLRKHVRAQ